jgi:hypothetical protein
MHCYIVQVVTHDNRMEKITSHFYLKLLPPFSPDLNPLDFSIYRAVLRLYRVQAATHKNLTALRAYISWEGT